ncbi:MAG: Hsp20/alpha crystallin family protein [Candidatus Promineifilaceae bacterium]|nr:Hsp20/alpha crystallin family protein [Candidatus Promineifilaceae bacterium]
MKIVRWNPNINRMRSFNEFDRFFERATDWPRWQSQNFGLAVDVTEDEDGYMVKASVPGINPDDVEITFEDNVLTIKGEIVEEENSEEVNYHIRERRSGSFGRSIRFPVDVNAESVEATYTNGVLTLNVPKTEEVKPKRIEVRVA